MNYKERIIEFLTPVFQEKGYVWRKSKDEFQKRISKNLTAFAYLTFSSRKFEDYAIVKIHLNAHYKDLEKAMHEIKKTKQIVKLLERFYDNPYLLSNYDDFHFTAADTREEYERKKEALIRYVREYALPVMEKMATEQGALEFLKKHEEEKDMFFRGHYPVAILVWKKDKQAALACAEHQLKIYQDSVPEIEWERMRELKRKVLKSPTERLSQCVHEAIRVARQSDTYPSKAAAYEDYEDFVENLRKYISNMNGLDK